MMDADEMQRNTICCLVENGVKCTRPAGMAAYNKRIQRNVAQRKLNLVMEKKPLQDDVSNKLYTYINKACFLFKAVKLP